MSTWFFKDSWGKPIMSTKWLGNWAEVMCPKCGEELLVSVEEMDKPEAKVCWGCREGLERHRPAIRCDCGADKSEALGHYRWCSAVDISKSPGKTI